MIGIAYPATPGKATTFAYDGLGRRTTISHTPAGGGAAVASNYVWCGDKPCQARDASNQPQRAYYTEGERLLGSSPESLFYGVDQLGSVRRAFASPTSAPAYSYDPYGMPLQTTASLADFGYAGLLNEPDSGLGLATYRAYDPKVGRWISRDPIGERGDPARNLYGYVGEDPINHFDPLGLWTVNIGISGSINIPLYGPVGIGGVGFGGIAFDSNGNVGWYYGGGGGPGGGAGISGGIQVGGSNGATICDLRGPFGALGGAAGEGIVGGGDVYTGSGVTGGNVYLGLGAGTPVSGTGGVTLTYVN
ncbi:RHS repeat-associated core domain-containing protein [Pleomorphomonas sp. PLEO]|uniref:RHS repeat-associated core domain-containing protein n=1 Tax=Pleomorphomonas sp. PLEO TaxID=3239306 RepID=UPI00351DE790